MYKITLCLNLKEKIYYISPIYRLIICIECYITYESVRWVAYSNRRKVVHNWMRDAKITKFHKFFGIKFTSVIKKNQYFLEKSEQKLCENLFVRIKHNFMQKHIFALIINYTNHYGLKKKKLTNNDQ